MASVARKDFDKNAGDIQRLLELHTNTGGVQPGRKYGLEVLNKSAIVLITAFWEAYCEDIAAEALEHMIKHLGTPDKLSKTLKQQVVKELAAEKNELAVWALAAEGWKKVLKDRLERLREQRNRKLNTPKVENIDDLFRNALGIDKVSSSWRWHRMSVGNAREKLDKYVTLRGEIAHRGSPASSVTKSQVIDYFEFIKNLAAKTGGRVNTHVNDATGKRLW